MFEAIINEIRAHDTVILHRHFRPDGDAMGSQIGMKHLILENFPGKQVYMVGDGAGYLSFMEDSVMDQIPDSAFDGALSMILDCGGANMVSDNRYSLAHRTVRMDHHLYTGSFTDGEVIDSSFESCCGFIALMAMECGWKLNVTAARSLYTGMVTDSGRFRYEGVNGDTLRCAAAMLDIGIDTETLYANLYLDTYDALKFTAHVYEKMQQTENGVAYIFVDKAMQEQFNLTLEQAGSCVNDMDSIRGCLAWIAFIETGDEKGTIRVRLRSRFVHINGIAEKYRGGGHACASGATLYSKDEIALLLHDADAHVKEYKETHEGWL